MVTFSTTCDSALATSWLLGAFGFPYFIQFCKRKNIRPLWCYGFCCSVKGILTRASKWVFWKELPKLNGTWKVHLLVLSIVYEREQYEAQNLCWLNGDSTRKKEFKSPKCKIFPTTLQFCIVSACSFTVIRNGKRKCSPNSLFLLLVEYKIRTL